MFLQTPRVSPEQIKGEKNILIKIINDENTKADAALTAGDVFLILSAINSNTVKTTQQRVIVCVRVCVCLPPCKSKLVN